MCGIKIMLKIETFGGISALIIQFLTFAALGLSLHRILITLTPISNI